MEQLLHSIDKNYTLSEEAAEIVLELADDFLTKLCAHSAVLARHRHQGAVEASGEGTEASNKSKAVLQARDVSLCLEKEWQLVVPGLSPLLPMTSAKRTGTHGEAAITQQAHGTQHMGNRRPVKRKADFPPLNGGVPPISTAAASQEAKKFKK
uniref:Transcription initiation factor TFIID subunit 12 domain-containing protein n=1 Tax=Fibrocapsa japonica TaxID=94617 RepID=A0A7S2V1K9_9STRA